MSRYWLNQNHQTQTLSFTSGKGGVGKSTMVANFAVQLARQGKKVLLLDGDLGMANLDLMFGFRTSKTIYDVLNGRNSLEEVIVTVHEGIDLIPGGSGIYELTEIAPVQKHMLLQQISSLENQYDYMLIDTAPGIDDNVLYLNSAAQQINVILTPDPASMTDAYALIKVLNQRRNEEKFSIICNQVRSEEEGLKLYQKLYDVSSQFLYVSLEYLGSIPLDPALSRATRQQEILSLSKQRALASLAISDLSKKMSSFSTIGEAKGGLQFFWQQLVGLAS